MAVPTTMVGGSSGSARFAALMESTDVLLRRLLALGVLPAGQGAPDVSGAWRVHAEPPAEPPKAREQPISIDSESEDEVPLSVRKRRLFEGRAASRFAPSEPPRPAAQTQPQPAQRDGGRDAPEAGGPPRPPQATAGAQAMEGEPRPAKSPSEQSSAQQPSGGRTQQSQQQRPEAAAASRPESSAAGAARAGAAEQRSPAKGDGRTASSRTTSLRGLQNSAPNLAEAIKKMRNSKAPQRAPAAAGQFIRPNWGAAAKLWQTGEQADSSPPKPAARPKPKPGRPPKAATWGAAAQPAQPDLDSFFAPRSRAPDSRDAAPQAAEAPASAPPSPSPPASPARAEAAPAADAAQPAADRAAADAAEWAARRAEIERQAAEARAERKRKRARTEVEDRAQARLEELRQREAAQQSAAGQMEQLRPIVKQRLAAAVAGRFTLAGMLPALGVAVPDVTPAGVERAYKKAVLQFHPDRHVASPLERRLFAEEAFKLISNARQGKLG